MPRIVPGRRVTFAERSLHLHETLDASGPAAVADRLVFVIPVLGGHPDFQFNVRVRSGRECHGHAAKRGQDRRRDRLRHAQPEPRQARAP